MLIKGNIGANLGVKIAEKSRSKPEEHSVPSSDKSKQGNGDQDAGRGGSASKSGGKSGSGGGGGGSNSSSSTTADKLLQYRSPLDNFLPQHELEDSSPPPFEPTPLPGAINSRIFSLPNIAGDLGAKLAQQRFHDLPIAGSTQSIAGAGPVLGLVDPDGGPEPLTPDQQHADDIQESVTADLDSVSNLSNTTEEEQAAATSSAATTLEDIENIEDPEIREQLLEDLAPQLEELGRQTNWLDHESAAPVIDSLTRAAESLGIEKARLLTGPFSRGLEAGQAERRDAGQPGSNASVLRDAIYQSIENEHGAIFGASLISELPVGSDFYSDILIGVDNGLREINSQFEAAAQKKDELDYRISTYVLDWGDKRSEEDIQKGIDAIRTENQAVLDDFEAASRKLDTTLDGVAILLTPDTQPPGQNGVKELAVLTAESIDANFAKYADSAVGRERIADAIVASGEGEKNFFTQAVSRLSGLSDITTAKNTADKVVDAIFKATGARAYSLVEAGDYAGASKLFAGFEELGGPLGLNVSDSAELSDLTELLAGQSGPSPKLGDLEFARQFNRKIDEISGNVGPESKSRAGKALGVLGLVVSAASLITSVGDTGNVNPESLLRNAISGTSLAGELGSLIPKGVAGKAFFTNIGDFAKLGVVFDTVDIFRSVRDGKLPEAGASTLGLIGGILSTTSIGGPPGTAVGAALSVVAVAGQFGVAQFRAGQAENESEEELAIFLDAAGFEEDEVELLQDVSRDTNQSIARVLTQIADRHPDLEPKDVLELLLKPGEYREDTYGGIPTSESFDNRRELIDLIVDLNRAENGEFTPEAVDEAISLFEEKLGVSVDASGLNPGTAVAALGEHFDNLDINGDDRVTKEELEAYVVEEERQYNYGGRSAEELEQRQELADLARYLLDREYLFDRLDRGGVEFGLPDGKISRDDIADVLAQNQALDTVSRHRDVFETANRNNTPDSVISKGDLEAIRDGDYRDELITAAKYLLDNQNFLNSVDAGGYQYDPKYSLPDGDLEIAVADGDLRFEDIDNARVRLGIPGG